MDSVIGELSRSWNKVFLDNRPGVWDNTWLREPYWQRDLIAARTLLLADEFNVMVPESALHGYVKKIWQAAGLETGRNIITYADEVSRTEKLLALYRDNFCIAMQWPMPESKLPAWVYHVPRELIIYLNNKHNIDYICPAESRPLIYRGGINGALAFVNSNLLWPVVIKAGLAQPSAGGDDVHICQSAEESLRAIGSFEILSGIVIESWVEHHRNMCAQFVVAGPGEVTYLGASEQIIDGGTKHVGNRFGKSCVIPQDALSSLRDIAAFASSMGYTGIVGFDVLIADEPPTYKIIDANFRFNGSTVALLKLRNSGSELSTDDQVSSDIAVLYGSEQYKRLIQHIENGQSTPLAAIYVHASNMVHATMLNRT